MSLAHGTNDAQKTMGVITLALIATGNFLARTVDWLRAGYPSGVPRQDYVALLGLLRRKLTEDEVHQIAADLAAQAERTAEPVTTPDIEQIIKESVLQPASEEDVARVSARLAAGGWPLVDPPAPDAVPA